MSGILVHSAHTQSSDLTVCVHMRPCMPVCLYVHACDCVYVSVYLSVCVSVFVCVCMHLCVCVCECMHSFKSKINSGAFSSK